MEVFFDFPSVLLERTIKHCNELLLYSLKFLLHGSVNLTLIVFKVTHDVVLFVSDALFQFTKLLQALTLAIWKVSMPRFPLAVEYWLAGWIMILHLR